MRHLPLMLGCACVLAVHAGPLAAQATADTITAAFRPGEWGVGFIVRSSVTEAGVLRFSTPTRAWVLDGSASFDRQSISSTSQVVDQKANGASVSAQFGPRWYHAVSSHGVRFLGLGISSGYAWSDASGPSSDGSLWSVGAYGEAGMQYMLTRYLGLGWRGTLSASRADARNTNTSGQGFVERFQAISYRVFLDAVQITGNIYF